MVDNYKNPFFSFKSKLKAMKVPYGVTCYAGNAIIKLNAKILPEAIQSLRREFPTLTVTNSLETGLTRIEGCLMLDSYKTFKFDLDNHISRRKIAELRRELYSRINAWNDEVLGSDDLP